MGRFFALAGTSSNNEVLHVHERGLRVGLWNFAVIVSVNLTPIISGYLIPGLSWRWGFWLEVIPFGHGLNRNIIQVWQESRFGGILFFIPECTQLETSKHFPNP